MEKRSNENSKQEEVDGKDVVREETAKQTSRKKYTLLMTVTETYYHEVEAQDAEEAYRLCEDIAPDDLELDDSLGEWSIEDEEEIEQGAA